MRELNEERNQRNMDSKAGTLGVRNQCKNRWLKERMTATVSLDNRKSTDHSSGNILHSALPILDIYTVY